MFAINGIIYKSVARAYNDIRPEVGFFTFRGMVYDNVSKLGVNKDISSILENIKDEPFLVLTIDGIEASFFHHCDRFNKKPSSVYRMSVEFLKNDFEKALKFRDTRGMYNIANVLRDEDISKEMVNIYFIRFNIEGCVYYKFGITKRTVKERFSGMSISILGVKLTELRNAVYYEKEVAETFSDKFNQPSDSFVGKTEVLSNLKRTDIEKIKNILNKY